MRKYPDVVLRQGVVDIVGHFAMKNGRCRYHGGKSTGAKHPHKPIKHGRYTKEAILERRAINKFLKDARDGIKEILG